MAIEWVFEKKFGQSPVSQGIAKRHSGKWIALRGARVAASAVTYEQLQGNPRVRATDMVYHVPTAHRQRFLATH